MNRKNNHKYLYTNKISESLLKFLILEMET